MFVFQHLNVTSGFDARDHTNAVNNCGASSIIEFGDYIYVGTKRRYDDGLYGYYEPKGHKNTSENKELLAEIWRYKKNGMKAWERVLQSHASDHILGFSVMKIYQDSIFAGGDSDSPCIYKSSDGVTWNKCDTTNMEGSSVTSIVELHEKLYVSTVDNKGEIQQPYVYVSKDKDCETFEVILSGHNIDSSNDESKEDIYEDKPNIMWLREKKSKESQPKENQSRVSQPKQPYGRVEHMHVFDGKLYLALSTQYGVELWRSNTDKPEKNQWTLIESGGFGDAANQKITSCAIYQDHLYLSLAKLYPVNHMVPFGFELIRVNAQDHWELVVGGQPLQSTRTRNGERTSSLSGFLAGFNNYFNLYGWQMVEYEGQLIITTLNSANNMMFLRNLMETNKERILQRGGEMAYSIVMECYDKMIELLHLHAYPMGFDCYSSVDGVHFEPEVLDGINNSNNYGACSLYVSNDNDLFLGTFNPYEGCEIWKLEYYHLIYEVNYNTKAYYDMLNDLNQELIKLIPFLLTGINLVWSEELDNMLKHEVNNIFKYSSRLMNKDE